MPQNKDNPKKSLSFKGRVWRQGRFSQSEFHIKNGRIVQGLVSPPIKAAYIIPPFVEPHIHGGWGYDFENNEFGPLENKLKRSGIFCAVPTISCSSLNRLKKISAQFEKYKAKKRNTIFTFLRVEGPFINPAKKGVQEEKNILFPEAHHIEEWLNTKNFKVFTLAPETKNSDIFVQKALQKNKIPSAGHSQAEFKDLIKLYHLGLRHMTHFPNAMSGLHHREIGLTGAGLLIDDLQIEFIADGIHNSMDFFRILLKIKGPEFSLTSDMVPQALSRKKKFSHRNIDRTGRRITTKNHILAGGGTSVPEQVTALFKQGIKPEEIIPLACVNSLKFFNLPLTELKPGEEASFVVLNQSFEKEAVIEKGKKISGDVKWQTD